MDNINWNSLRTFLYVATSNSFLDASNKLVVSQPAISKSIKNLEDQLNVNLFFRGNKGICLTPNGEILLKYVKDAYNTLLAAERMLIKENDTKTGSIVIGAQSHIVRYYLLNKLAKFKEDNPLISIRIIDLSTRDLLEALEKHVVDFVIDSSPIETIYNNTIVKPIAYLDTCFIKSNKNNKVFDNLELIENENIILPLERSSLRKTLERELEEKGVKLVPTIEYETEEIIIESVRRNMGVGYVVKNAVDYLVDEKLIDVIDLDMPLPKVEINLIYVESYLTNIANKFIKDYINKGDIWLLQ